MRAGPEPAFGRLLKRRDFLAAGRGRKFHTERISLQGLRRDSEDGTLRIGLTITRKVGHATERNRVRRRLRAACSEAVGRLGAAPYDVVVIGRRPVLEAAFPILVDDLARGLRVVTDASGGRSRPRRAEA
jgi:ribonuclease P protein component